MSTTAEYRSWNECYSCRQPIAIECVDGAIGQCLGCRRAFVCVHCVGLSERGARIEAWKLEETYRSQKTVQHRKRGRR